MLSNNLLHQVRRCQSSGVATVVRGYISRAHPPETTPAFPVGEALADVLKGVEERKAHRQQRWDKGAQKRKAEGIEVSVIIICLCFTLWQNYHARCTVEDLQYTMHITSNEPTH